MDAKFRDIGPLLRRGTEAMEEYQYSLLHFREVCSYGWQMDTLECVRKMCARAKQSGVSLSMHSVGQVGWLRCGFGKVWPACLFWCVVSSSVPASMAVVVMVIIMHTRQHNYLTVEWDGSLYLRKTKTHHLNQFLGWVDMLRVWYSKNKHILCQSISCCIFYFVVYN